MVLSMSAIKTRDVNELSTQSNIMDILDFEDAKEEFENIQQTINKNQEKLCTIEKLANDLHNALRRRKPTLKPTEEIVPSHRHNKNIMNKIMETTEYQELHNTTRGDEWATALATDSIIRGFMKNMDPKMLEEIDSQSHKARELDDEKHTLEDMVDRFKEMLENDDLEPKQKEMAQHNLKRADSDLNDVQGKVEELDTAMDNTGKAMGRMVRVAVKQAQKEAEKEIDEVQGIAGGWGTGLGDLKKLPTQQKKELAEQIKNNKKLQQIASQLGAMKQITTTKRKNRYGKRREEVYSVGLGRDIALALPSEKGLLMNADTEDLFYKRFLDGNLLQYELRGKEKQGRGAIICAIDVSGSMGGLNREIWAKVFALGLLEIAGREKRDFAVIFFDTMVRETIRIPKEMKPMERLQTVLRIAEFFTGGGTTFEQPLDTAKELLNEKEFNKADIVMITDGECTVSDSWLGGFLKWRNANKVTIQGILVGRPVHHLHKFCQQTHSIVDLFSAGENDKVHNVFSLMS